MFDDIQSVELKKVKQFVGNEFSHINVRMCPCKSIFCRWFGV